MSGLTRTLVGMLSVAVIVSVAVVGSALAQRPRVSPRGTVETHVDGASISMEYGRPSKRGRVIWGALVPWNHWWMPGADESTTIKTDAALTFADTLTMPAGEYSVYTLPGPDVFKLIIVNQTGLFHTRYPSDRDLGRVNMTLKKLTEPVEQLTFMVEPREGGGGTFKLVWDDREYSVPFVVKKHP